MARASADPDPSGNQGTFADWQELFGEQAPLRPADASDWKTSKEIGRRENQNPKLKPARLREIGRAWLDQKEIEGFEIVCSRDSRTGINGKPYTVDVYRLRKPKDKPR